MKSIVLVSAFLAVLVWMKPSGLVYAHGFGERYDLPIPLDYYFWGSAAAILLSFAVIGAFVKAMPEQVPYWRWNLLGAKWAAWLFSSNSFKYIIQAISVLSMLLVIATGMWGNQNPGMNLAPTFVWIIWWVGLVFAIAAIGNFWLLVNPWSILFEGVEYCYDYFKPGRRLWLGYDYPRSLSVWPSLGFFICFAWFENVSPGASLPAVISVMVIAYSIITWVGMAFFGREVWLCYGEVFSVIFGFFARLAPTELRVTNTSYCGNCLVECNPQGTGCINCYPCWSMADTENRQLNIRPFAVGLIEPTSESSSRLALVVAVLATVTFDGFMETPVWFDIKGDLWGQIHMVFEDNTSLVIDSVGLLFAPVMFIGLFMYFSLLMRWTSGTQTGAIRLMAVFAYSLLPIALAYHVAHFFTLLVIQGQLIIPLASDPFGYGWNLFGTSGYRVNIGLIDAKFAWFLGVSAIVLGHIVAVYIAHMIALRVFENRQQAIRSQYPMLGLMVLYTVVSLWIIAQPMVE